MDDTTIVNIILISALILLSAFFSATEIAFSSLNEIKLKHMIQNGHKRAKKTLELSENFDKVLTTILIGNNIVNIASASLATLIFIQYWGNAGVTISTAVMTVLVLVFGEITPKSIAKRIPESFALAVTYPLLLFMFILAPLNLIFNLWQKLMTKLFKFQETPSITEDELLTYVSEAQQEGGINENEEEMIRNVIDFDDLKIEEIFTPRVKVVAVSVNETTKKITHAFRHHGFSRLPVYEGSIDHIIGVMNYKDYFNKVLLDRQPVENIIKKPVFVTEYMKISHLLELLKVNKSHMAIVKDEYGGTLGIVTMEDILEEIVGDIFDEHDEIIEQIKKIDDTHYQVKGDTDLDDLFEILEMEEDEDADYATVNGWVQDQLGRIPLTGDVFRFRFLKVTVTEADHKRVLEVSVEVLPISLVQESDD
jgi:CBS domain containing-hemolysin-like protein